MPVHLNTTVTRRQFLGGSLASLIALSYRQPVFGNVEAQAADPNLFAILSDTHLPEKRDTVGRGIKMFDHMQQVVGEILASPERPSGVIINGDVAYLKGLIGDYRTVAEAVEPLLSAGFPLHLNMGNHDHRGNLYEVMASQKREHNYVDSKHITLLETPHANLFLLDTLFETDVVTGDVGEQQRKWLDEAVRAASDKPAVVIAHHNLQFTPPAEGKAWGGIRDTAEFYDLLKSHPNIKAYLYGHTHVWQQTKMDDLHLINLPPVAYVFQEGHPSGWILGRFKENGMSLQLQTIDKTHPLNQQLLEIDWS